jgi:ketosteroid isomerase-like protein
MNDVATLLTAWADAERTLDTTRTDQLLTDDFVGVGPVGFELSKRAWMQRQSDGGLHYDHLDIDEVTTRTHGDCAITTARWNARGTARGHPIPEATRITLVSVRDEGDWRVAGLHFSFIADPPGRPGAS